MRAEIQTGVLEDRTQEILQMDDSILSVAIVDTNGRTLVSQKKFGAKDVFAPKRTSEQDDFGTWTRDDDFGFIPRDDKAIQNSFWNLRRTCRLL